MNNYRISAAWLGAMALLLATPIAAWAHVVVKPSQVGVAASQIFTMGVPSERDAVTTKMRLLIPDGLQSVTPNVKPGWTIDVIKSGSGDNAKVTEIDWSGGSIPSGQRDDFAFSAQAPNKATELDWKAYQTYDDGTVVAWDQKPSAKEADNDNATAGPYSITSVINDLTASTTPQPSSTDTSADSWLAPVAIVISLFALYLAWRGNGLMQSHD